MGFVTPSKDVASFTSTTVACMARSSSTCAPSEAAIISAMTHSAGSRIGRYEVVGLLGTGGMGEVYLARDTQLGREVAVKIVALHATDDPLAHARLVREAQNASILNHPHICTIHEVGETAEHAFFVMEHVRGTYFDDDDSSRRAYCLTKRCAMESRSPVRSRTRTTTG